MKSLSGPTFSAEYTTWAHLLQVFSYDDLAKRRVELIAVDMICLFNYLMISLNDDDDLIVNKFHSNHDIIELSLHIELSFIYWIIIHILNIDNDIVMNYWTDMNPDDSLVAKWAFVELPFVDAAIFLAAHSKVVKSST